jgi:hypothetical protein
MNKHKQTTTTTTTTGTAPATHPQAQTAPLTIEQTLEQREATHGDFADVAGYAQLMKDLLRNSIGYINMNDAQREACEAWLCKTARLMAGDVDHIDHPHDVAGYATLYVRACGARRVDRAVADAVAELEAAMAAPRYDAGDVTVTLVGGAAAA